MSFIQREIDRVASEMEAARGTVKYRELYAARQALSWALEPGGFASPYNMIMGILATKADCSVPPRPPQSSDISAHSCSRQ